MSQTSDTCVIEHSCLAYRRFGIHVMGIYVWCDRWEARILPENHATLEIVPEHTEYLIKEKFLHLKLV